MVFGEDEYPLLADIRLMNSRPPLQETWKGCFCA